MKKVSKHFKKVALISAMGLAFGFSQSATAGAATATVTVTGNSVAACTISNGTVDFGNIVLKAGITSLKTFTMQLNCATGTSWGLDFIQNYPLTVGTDTTSNYINIVSNGNLSLSGIGTGLVQTVSLQAFIRSGTVPGVGVISASVPVTFTF